MPAEPVNDQHPDETEHRTTVTIREYYAYKLMIRPDEEMNLYLGGRLWQQFIVDAFAAVELYRLDWIRNHQSTIRSDLYRSIREQNLRRTEASVLKKGVLLDNQYVVPYNRDLLLRFHCHINLEVCNSSRSLKYLFKYCLKGHDAATMLLRKKNIKDTPDESTTKAKSTDEIKNFLDGRYICVSEAAWRLLGFNKHHHFPSIERSPVHMEDEKSVSFKPHDDLGYNKEHNHEEHDKLYRTLNIEQLHAYASIIDSIENGKGGVFFVYGSGGCGKTFLWNTFCCKLCSVRRVLLPVASSGIVARLLPGRRTTHSRFHILLKVDEYSVSGIKHGTELGELLKQTSLIIWDKAPMQNQYAAESVDCSLRDIMTSLDPERASLPFGGITIIFGGEFWQILPVIPKASRAQVLGKEHSYFSQDSLVDSEGDNNDFGSAFPLEYLNSINMPWLPKHHLKIKEGCVIMLMRNLNQIMGLCNGTRMIVKRCLPNSIVCDILTSSQVGTTHIIPRI
ncbi:uncharacterized protein LOC141660283 [Apium graveolens]|uniref:uncharacterized protein LOC141660283 n=1 Tax=Apium graveolens TaxID=4045 RepID=UPI003D78D89E